MTLLLHYRLVLSGDSFGLLFLLLHAPRQLVEWLAAANRNGLLDFDSPLLSSLSIWFVDVISFHRSFDSGISFACT